MTAQSANVHPWVAQAREGPRFGLLLGGSPDWSVLRRIAQTAEAAGFDSLWIPDHPVLSPSSSWTTLAALAECTRTVRLGTLVSCALFRHPVVLAGEVAEVDRISGGRVVLGLGSGDAPEEFRRMGLPCPPVAKRQEALEEVLQIVPQLLAGKTVSYSGKHFQLSEARLALPAVQRPRVPVLIAGGGPRTTLRFVATYGDACNIGAASWAGGGFTGEDARQKLEVLDRRCAEVGRDARSIVRTSIVGPLFLAETEQAARAKLDKLPPWVITGGQGLPGLEALVFAGTPERAVTYVRELLDAGHQYLIYRALESDPETLELLSNDVMPAVLAASAGV
ncbi:MAG TPA: LLM class flavin-dependent oxidoreductase [Ktedonobacterales bacterium]|nr:LLM class flavin-dependent oxidoreductase [Ktedonobacterales bacterium]